MIKALYKVRDGLQFELEAKEQTDIFHQLASLQEVFGEKTCHLCKSEDLTFVVRYNKDEDPFYELRCKSCGAKLSYSQNKKGGTLYPVRKLKNGMPAKVTDEGPFDYKTGGWYKYDKDKVPQKPNDGKPNARRS